MPRDVKTFRLTKFKGLNTSVNPHNIDDAEMTAMVNLELTKDSTLQTRKGYSVLTNPSAGASSMSTMFVGEWSTSNQPLYYCTNLQLYKYVSPTSTFMSIALKPAYTHTQFRRYKDKVLWLMPTASPCLFWFDSTEAIKPVKYPRLQVSTPEWSTAIAASSGGSLEASKTYQYAISLVLGTDRRDGETCCSLPGNTIDIPEDPKNPNPEHRSIYLVGDYARGTTTVDNKTLTATNLKFSGLLYGFEPSMIKLFRRKATVKDGQPYAPDTEWVLVDHVYMSRLPNSTTYSFTTSLYGRINTTTTTATKNNTDDSITILLNFVDNKDSDYLTGHIPRPPYSETAPSAKYMTRFNNRIFLANMVSNQPKDKKLVSFSYRPGNPNGDEIEGFKYEEPMLIFPPFNNFYCDAEDIDDEITAIYTYQDNVVIFTNNCMFIWREGMYDPAKVANDVGCVAQHSIREFEGKLIWLSKNGVYTFNGTKVENISFSKVNSYIGEMAMAYAGKACGCIYNRQYWLTAPYGSGINNHILVYDFDLEEWHVREYDYDGTNDFYIQFLYTHRSGNTETLYASGVSGGTLVLATLEDTYADNGQVISASFKTKYFDFGAPDIQKHYRSLYLDFENYSRGLTLDIFTDTLDSSTESITYNGNASGFIINDNTGTTGVLNQDAIVNVTNEMIGFSVNRGIVGSRLQLDVNFDAYGAPTKLHALAIDWRPMRKVKKRYGDGS